MRGDQIRLTATGSVTIGPFVGRAGPAGVDGCPNYRFDSRFPLGSLLGRFDDEGWFLVGSARTITAPMNGTLDLKINDNDVGNNEGSFDVRYVIEPQSR